MTSENREKLKRDENKGEPKEEPKQGYRKPELTKFGPVEKFTGQPES